MTEQQSKIATIQNRRAELVRMMKDSDGIDWAEGERCRREIRLCDRVIKSLQA